LRWIAVNLILLLVAATACGEATSQPAVPSAFRKAITLQLGLEHAGFSPGLIDGKAGAKTSYAIEEFQRANALAVTGKPDDATLAALELPGEGPFTIYTITSDDSTQVTGTTTDWNERAAMKFLGYESLEDLVAERFHTSRVCLSELNPGVDLDHLSVGDVLTVPDVGGTPTSYRHAAKIEVNLEQKTIRLFDTDEKVIGLFFCSIARDKEKRPSGDATVKTIAINPEYTFDPALWTDVTNVDHKLTIPPGPRNPVGLAWVGLSLPGYGMHGTPHPEQIGKTGSHGCFRLTNWDAIRLANMVSVGTPVVFK
jgi:lipoprotein-anchoring transpeptidase ErfK/SrfK